MVAPAARGDRSARALLAVLAAQEGGAGRELYASLKRGLSAAADADPFDAAVFTVLGGALLFYLAEKERNPKVTSYFDALVFISTSLSVGYADVFARTPAGKAIAAAIMTFGPALSGAILSRRSEERSAVVGERGRSTTPRAVDSAATPMAGPPTGEDRRAAELIEVQRAILGRLDAILAELRRTTTDP
jgi:hypothetical protein